MIEARRGRLSRRRRRASDGTLRMTTGCNTASAPWTLVRGTLTIDRVATTLMACEQPLMEQETALTKALSAARTADVSPDSLTLLDAGGE